MSRSWREDVRSARPKHHEGVAGCDLLLTTRAWNCLRNERITTIDQLCGMTARDLLRAPNLGRATINTIVEALAWKGRKLKEEGPL